MYAGISYRYIERVIFVNVYENNVAIKTPEVFSQVSPITVLPLYYSSIGL